MNVARNTVIAAALLLVGTTLAHAAPSVAMPKLDGVTIESVTDAARVLSASVPKEGFSDLRAIGVGLVIIGAAMGIGWLAASAVQSMARQPEAAGQIQTAMIIAAALIEGVTFFALIIIMLFVQQY